MSAPEPNERSGAEIVGPYRYRLWRSWADGSRLLWIMLNPSTADANTDDATIRRCCGFARAWGYSGIEVVNLYALRSTNPAELLTHRAPIGPLNDQCIGELALVCCDRVAAWGAHPMAGAARVRRVREIVGAMNCLGLTSGGAPKHPVRLPNSTQRQAFTAEARSPR